MRKKYNFANAIRNPHAREYRKGTNLVKLDPDVAKVFPDSDSVNRVLRLVGSLISGKPSGSRARTKKTAE
jgi:hypothetical protein